jgi:hypothetical protein
MCGGEYEAFWEQTNGRSTSSAQMTACLEVGRGLLDVGRGLLQLVRSGSASLRSGFERCFLNDWSAFDA